MSNRLLNPFTPRKAASRPDEFFGREPQIEDIDVAIEKGHVAIHGGIGIGKSSLLSQFRLLLDGFDFQGAYVTQARGASVVAIGNRDVETIDQAANLFLKRLMVLEKEEKSRFTLKLTDFISYQLEQTDKYPDENRYLTVLERLIQEENAQADNYVAFAIDEADKCPKALAKLLRSLITLCDQESLERIRFVCAGVSPYFQEMVNEDPGMAKYFEPILLLPMQQDEAYKLVDAKLQLVTADSKAKGIDLSYKDELVDQVAQLSGGHPHLLQLLGSHLIDNHNRDPDPHLDSRDLFKALERICYNDRAPVYKKLIAKLDMHGVLVPFKRLLGVANAEYPTFIATDRAMSVVEVETIEWLIVHDVIGQSPLGDGFRLLDEFLRVRLLMDEHNKPKLLERQLLEEGAYYDEEQEFQDAYLDVYQEEHDEMDADAFLDE